MMDRRLCFDGTFYSEVCVESILLCIQIVMNFKYISIWPRLDVSFQAVFTVVTSQNFSSQLAQR